MLHPIICVLMAFLLAFAFRMRGGGFINFGSDTPPRLLWAALFTAAAFGIMPIHDATNTHSLIFLGLFPLGYLLVLIPHAAFQAMGRNTYPYNLAPPIPTPWTRHWTAFWLSEFTQAEWMALSKFEKTAVDFEGMLSVGFFRGLLVFAPFAIYQDNYGSTAIAITVTTFGQALSYLLGYYIPFQLPSLGAKSTEWCEFLNGASWAAAFAAYLMT